MNDMFDALAKRRSVPPSMLGPPGPGPSELDAMLVVASRVPDHGRLVPWRFLVIQGDARHHIGEAMSRIHLADAPDATDARLKVERERFAQAPLVIGIVAKRIEHAKVPLWEQTLSVGAATMNLIVGANLLGFSSCWLTGWMAYDRRALDALGLSGEEVLAGFVHIGTASGTVADRIRPPLKDVVMYL